MPHSPEAEAAAKAVLHIRSLRGEERRTFELRYANLLLQEMTAKAIARFQYRWECIAVRLVVRQRLAAQGFKPSKPRIIEAPKIPMDFSEMGRALAHVAANMGKQRANA